MCTAYFYICNVICKFVAMFQIHIFVDGIIKTRKDTPSNLVGPQSAGSGVFPSEYEPPLSSSKSPESISILLCNSVCSYVHSIELYT